MKLLFGSAEPCLVHFVGIATRACPIFLLFCHLAPLKDVHDEDPSLFAREDAPREACLTLILVPQPRAAGMAPFSPQPSFSHGSHVPPRRYDSLSFSRPPPPPSRARRRNGTKRAFAVVGFLLLILLLDALWMRSLLFGPSETDAATPEATEVEAELLELLVKHKQAMEARPPLEEIQSYADRFKVLLVSLLLSESVRRPELNVSHARSRDKGHRQLPRQT